MCAVNADVALCVTTVVAIIPHTRQSTATAEPSPPHAAPFLYRLYAIKFFFALYNLQQHERQTELRYVIAD